MVCFCKYQNLSLSDIRSISHILAAVKFSSRIIMGCKFDHQKVGNIQLEKRKKIQEKSLSLVANMTGITNCIYILSGRTNDSID